MPANSKFCMREGGMTDEMTAPESEVKGINEAAAARAVPHRGVSLRGEAAALNGIASSCRRLAIVAAARHARYWPLGDDWC